MSIDGKPKFRVPSARGNRRKPVDIKPTDVPVVEEESLNIRVKERSGDDEVKKGGRISGFLETPIKGLMSNTAAAAESLKRPLTGIFRRPGSKAGKRKEEEDDMVTAAAFTEPVPPPPIVKTAPNIEAVLSAMDFEGSSKAPKMPGAPFQGMLQNDAFSKHPHLNKVDDIDLSLLSRIVCLEEESNDETVSWTWDYLFTTISSELRDEWAEGGMGPPPADRRVG